MVRIRDAERFPNVPKPDISAARTICLPSWRIVELIARRFRWNVVLRGGQLFTESFEGNWLHRRGAWRPDFIVYRLIWRSTG
ncbi:hypothetical protein IVB57_23800 [Bradyrhizobium sp. CW9]|uniref:hypothetical protein n=1 Tax=Bradyrhizobium sp. CW9 TaxID=2782689 RepID=UPI001FF81EE6|nr:hypothetical protein [Bradyrhizobium sp. CW9]MCK1331350.1 hypothetical protein [Bradyrhizobium sp. CW9]